MEDWEIERWNNEGKVFLWRYRDDPKNDSGYHLTADQAGCRFLLGLIERFRDSKSPARKRFALAHVGRSQLAVPNCPAAAVGCRRLELRFDPEWEPGRAVLTEMSEMVVLELGRDRLSEFEKGVGDIRDGDGDWAMNCEGSSLWFWW